MLLRDQHPILVAALDRKFRELQRTAFGPVSEEAATAALLPILQLAPVTVPRASGDFDSWAKAVIKNVRLL